MRQDESDDLRSAVKFSRHRCSKANRLSTPRHRARLQGPHSPPHDTPDLFFEKSTDKVPDTENGSQVRLMHLLKCPPMNASEYGLASNPLSTDEFHVGATEHERYMSSSALEPCNRTNRTHVSSKCETGSSRSHKILYSDSRVKFPQCGVSHNPGTAQSDESAFAVSNCGMVAHNSESTSANGLPEHHGGNIFDANCTTCNDYIPKRVSSKCNNASHHQSPVLSYKINNFHRRGSGSRRPSIGSFADEERSSCVLPETYLSVPKVSHTSRASHVVLDDNNCYDAYYINNHGECGCEDYSLVCGQMCDSSRPPYWCNDRCAVVYSDTDIISRGYQLSDLFHTHLHSTHDQVDLYVSPDICADQPVWTGCHPYGEDDTSNADFCSHHSTLPAGRHNCSRMILNIENTTVFRFSMSTTPDTSRHGVLFITLPPALSNEIGHFCEAHECEFPSQEGKTNTLRVRAKFDPATQEAEDWDMYETYYSAELEEWPCERVDVRAEQNDFFTGMKRKIRPHVTKVDVAVNLHHISPFKNRRFLIVYLSRIACSSSPAPFPLERFNLPCSSVDCLKFPCTSVDEKSLPCDCESHNCAGGVCHSDMSARGGFMMSTTDPSQATCDKTAGGLMCKFNPVSTCYIQASNHVMGCDSEGPMTQFVEDPQLKHLEHHFASVTSSSGVLAQMRSEHDTTSSAIGSGPVSSNRLISDVGTNGALTDTSNSIGIHIWEDSGTYYFDTPPVIVNAQDPFPIWPSPPGQAACDSLSPPALVQTSVHDSARTSTSLSPDECCKFAQNRKISAETSNNSSRPRALWSVTALCAGDLVEIRPPHMKANSASASSAGLSGVVPSSVSPLVLGVDGFQEYRDRCLSSWSSKAHSELGGSQHECYCCNCRRTFSDYMLGDHDETASRSRSKSRDSNTKLTTFQCNGVNIGEANPSLLTRGRDSRSCCIQSRTVGEVLKVYVDDASENTVADVRLIQSGQYESPVLSGVDLAGLQLLHSTTANDKLRHQLQTRYWPPPYYHFNGPSGHSFCLYAGLWADFSLSLPEEGAICFFWDTEATGLNTSCDDITQIGCVSRLMRNGQWIEMPDEKLASFSIHVATDQQIPAEVLQLTGITNEYLNANGVSLTYALECWEDWCRHVIEVWSVVGRVVWFVAHNGNSFDLPLLMAQEERKCGWTKGTFLRKVGVDGIVDTVILSRRLIWPNGGRRSHKLHDLYRNAVGTPMEGQHDALGDCKALAELMKQEPFLCAWTKQPIAWTLDEYFEAFGGIAQVPHKDSCARQTSAASAVGDRIDTSCCLSSSPLISLTIPADPVCCTDDAT